MTGPVPSRERCAATLPTVRAAVQAAGRLRDRWAVASYNRKIFGAALIVASLTFAVKVTGLLRDLLIASEFGRSDALDAYLIAFFVPNFVVGVVADSIATALLPVYVRARDQGGQLSARRLLAEATALSAALLGALVVGIALSSPYFLPWLAPSFDAEKLALTRTLLLMLAPTVVLSGLATVWASILNAGERFVLPAATPIVLPLVSAIGLLIAAGDRGVYGLALGLLLGTAFQLTLLGWGLRRAGMAIRPGWHGRTPDTSEAIRQFSRLVVGAVLVGGVDMVDQAMAASLGSGAVATYSYGTKLVQPLLMVGTIALGTAIFPYFSRMVAAGDWAGVQHTLKTYVILILAVSIPATIAVALLSEPMVRLTFERGAFTATDTRAVAHVQAIYALIIPFFSLGVLFSRLISSMRANHIMLMVTATMFITNAILDYVLKELYGVPGLAMASVGHYVLTASFLAFMLRRILRQKAAICG